jgi:hypothetical protein
MSGLHLARKTTQFRHLIPAAPASYPSVPSPPQVRPHAPPPRFDPSNLIALKIAVFADTCGNLIQIYQVVDA